MAATSDELTAQVVTVPITNGPRRVEYLVWSQFNPTPATIAFLQTLEID